MDVVFTEDSHLLSVLGKLEAVYVKNKVRLVDVLESSKELSAGSESQFLMLATPSRASEDLWCIDSRNVLTLSVCKETYEDLGIVGKPLPFKGQSDVHVIEIPLQIKPDGYSVKVRQKQQQSIEQWEKRREMSGSIHWDVVSCSNQTPNEAPDIPFTPSGASQARKVVCEQTNHANIHIPLPSFKPRPQTSRKGKVHSLLEDQEDWDREVMQLFEWVGLVALGSPRIHANDRPDPYVAVYEPPQPSTVGSVSHVAWTGFLAPSFVQSLIQQVSVRLQSSMEVDEQTQTPKFAFITVHSVSTSPVSYLSPASKEASNRLPRDDNEDTLCLLLGLGPSGRVSWTTIECLGQWDTRWG